MTSQHSDDFLHQSALAMAIVSVVIMTPFAINNFLRGRYILGVGALVIIGIFVFNTWTITQYSRYYAKFALLALVPAVLFFTVISMQNQGVIGILWCYPAVCAFYFMLPERYAWYANIALLVTTLPVAWHLFEAALASRMVATLVLVSSISAIFIRVINRQQTHLRQQVITDPLTGLMNRILLQTTLEEAIAQSQRTGTEMTLATLDIDNFKVINDTFGHDQGDKVLCGISQLVSTRVRRIDKVFRLGGEEFLILFYGSDAENGYLVAEAIREAIAQWPLLTNHRVTVSIGIATLKATEDWMAWMKRSDENLYRAKSSGRNRVMAYSNVQSDRR
ncbi:GGDEF domain-containing protein [filamentous cyanobacterium LEGE 11480]|uniref:GGDEF domain-containing protein n=1 Tax=Romeriopsis navalis LEGE 11480 TaxID=2777977 RepID=A0A928VPW4_9CYAN|nr:GGDEF domain-containing protein [Romeriopsis navalis]MBE9030352.1 GGDEF domain-containing protein [Romeriopsis navalis LEGE 11480]